MRAALTLVLALLSLRSGLAQESEASPRLSPWRVLLPLVHPVGADVTTSAGPEDELARMAAGGPGPDLTRTFAAKGGTSVGWRSLPGRAQDGPLADQRRIDLAKVGKGLPADNVVAYLHRTIEVRGPLEFPITLGSDDGLRLWLNGELLVDASLARGLSPAQHSPTLKLLPGTNHLLAKVKNIGGAWAFQMGYAAPFDGLARVAAQGDINRSIERGLAWLCAEQEIDGSWRSHADFGGGMTALALYTLLKCGVAQDHPASRRALARLLAGTPTRTYAAACELLALNALHQEEQRGRIADLAVALDDWRIGGYAYPDGDVDLSNTQYAVLGLRAAAQAGVPVSKKTWQELAYVALDHQTVDGGFSYHPGGSATGSMTCAGLGVLSICLEQLGENDRLPPTRMRQAEKALEAGTRWLALHWDLSKNPTGNGGDAGWYYYYLYGLERFGGVRGLERIGEREWYWEGAREILARQGDLGEWSSHGDPQASTCFALLFLKRATAPSTGESSAAQRSYGREDRSAEVSLMASGDAPLSLWTAGFGDALRREAAWPESEGGGLRVVSVEYLEAERVLARVEGDPFRPAGAERFGARVNLETNGVHEIFARVTLALPEPLGTTRVVESHPLAIPVSAVEPAWLAAYALDPSRNLLRSTRVEARASSEFDGNWTPGHAVDDRAGTGWLTKADDSERRLTLELAKPVKADRILLSHARTDLHADDDCARARTVELYVNRRKTPVMIELDPNVQRKTEYVFERSEAVRSLEIVVVDVLPGRRWVSSVGFSEVELRYAKEGSNR